MVINAKKAFITISLLALIPFCIALFLINRPVEAATNTVTVNIQGFNLKQQEIPHL